MIRNIAYTLITVGSLILVSCQTQKGYTHYRKGEFAEAATCFNKAIASHEKDEVMALYGLALTYTAPNNKRASNSVAYGYLVKMPKMMKDSSEKVLAEYEKKYGYRLDDDLVMSDSLALHDFEIAIKSPDDGVCSKYVKTYIEYPEYCYVVEQWRDTLRMRKERKEFLETMAKGFDVRDTWILKHRDSPYREEAIALQRDTLTPIYRRILATGEYYDLMTFRYRFPYYEPVDRADTLLTDWISSYGKATHDNWIGIYGPVRKGVGLGTAAIEFVKNCPNTEGSWVALMDVVSYLQREGRSAEVKSALKEGMIYLPSFKERILKSIALIEKKPKTFVKAAEALPSSVNWGKATNPVISPDGEKLYFSRHLSSADRKRDESRVYVSYRSEKGWQEATVEETFGKVGIVEPVCDNPAEGMLVYTDVLVNGRHFNYYGKKNDGSWGHRVDPRIAQALKAIDTYYTTDGQVMLYASYGKNRGLEYLTDTWVRRLKDYSNCPMMNYPHGYYPGNDSPIYDGATVSHKSAMGMQYHGSHYGDTDLFVCIKDSLGRWGEPIDLGSVINTPGREFEPVLASDLRTLYFVSDGHAGYGGCDVFVSRRLKEDSWTEWSEPVNLGSEINTWKDDMPTMRIMADGKTIFYKSEERDGYGRATSVIKTGELRGAYRAKEATVVKIDVKDEEGKYQKAKVSWRKKGEERTLGTLEFATGRVVVTLPGGGDYTIVIDSKGKQRSEIEVGTDKSRGKTVAHEIVMKSKEQSSRRARR